MHKHSRGGRKKKAGSVEADQTYLAVVIKVLAVGDPACDRGSSSNVTSAISLPLVIESVSPFGTLHPTDRALGETPRTGSPCQYSPMGSSRGGRGDSAFNRAVPGLVMQCLFALRRRPAASGAYTSRGHHRRKLSLSHTHMHTRTSKEGECVSVFIEQPSNVRSRVLLLIMVILFLLFFFFFCHNRNTNRCCWYSCCCFLSLSLSLWVCSEQSTCLSGVYLDLRYVKRVLNR